MEREDEKDSQLGKDRADTSGLIVINLSFYRREFPKGVRYNWRGELFVLSWRFALVLGVESRILHGHIE